MLTKNLSIFICHVGYNSLNKGVFHNSGPFRHTDQQQNYSSQTTTAGIKQQDYSNNTTPAGLHQQAFRTMTTAAVFTAAGSHQAPNSRTTTA
jgi:hypothetical protein